MKKIFTRLMFMAMGLGLFASVGNASSAPSANVPDPATIKASMDAFNNLSRKEKKARIKDVKKVLHDYKAAKKAGAEPVASTAVQVIVAILLPPLGVYLHEGEINSRFWISLVLWLLFYIPGLIYALIVILGDKSK